MYSSVKYKVKLSSGCTPAFSSNIGLKQGCNMSPSLFNVFINDIPELLHISNCDPIHLGTTKVLQIVYFMLMIWCYYRSLGRVYGRVLQN